MKLFVRNLSYGSADGDLRGLFETLGYVVSNAMVIMDSDGRSRGFGFVTIEGDGREAILDTHGSEHLGRVLHVEEAREKTKNGGSRGRRARRGRIALGLYDNFAWED